MAVIPMPVLVLFIALLVTSPLTAWWTPLFALCIIGLVLLAYRTFTMQVSVSDDDVAVRNVFRTRRFLWNDIARFGWGTQYGFPIGGVYLASERFIRAIALAPSLLGGDKAVPNALAGLNAELARHRPSIETETETDQDSPVAAAQLPLPMR